MIVVAGRIFVHPDARQSFLTSSEAAVALARRTPGCHDFVVAADPLEPNRVNIYEEWESEEALLRFRGDGPGEELGARILRAEVFRHVVASTGPA